MTWRRQLSDVGTTSRLQSERPLQTAPGSRRRRATPTNSFTLYVAVHPRRVDCRRVRDFHHAVWRWPARNRDCVGRIGTIAFANLAKIVTNPEQEKGDGGLFCRQRDRIVDQSPRRSAREIAVTVSVPDFCNQRYRQIHLGTAQFSRRATRNAFLSTYRHTTRKC